MNVASNKGLDGCLWFFLGFLFGPFGLLFALLSDGNSKGVEQRKIQKGDYKKCPYCAEVIKKEAIKCRHCGSELDSPASKSPVWHFQDFSESDTEDTKVSTAKPSIDSTTDMHWLKRGAIIIGAIFLLGWVAVEIGKKASSNEELELSEPAPERVEERASVELNSIEGSWHFNYGPGFTSTETFTIYGDQIEVHIEFGDGSVSDETLTVREGNEGWWLNYPNDHGDYYYYSKKGELSARDDYGVVAVARRK